MGDVMNDEVIGLGSNKLGWLHTFLNCINTLMTLMKCPPESDSLVLSNEKEQENIISGSFNLILQ